jgi:hypothetical protein
LKAIKNSCILKYLYSFLSARLLPFKKGRDNILPFSIFLKIIPVIFIKLKKRLFIWPLCSIHVLGCVTFPRYGYGSTHPIPKPLAKTHSNTSNYRLISLLSSISKVFEKISLKRLQYFISAIISCLTINLVSGWPTLHPTNLEEWFTKSKEEGNRLCPNPRACCFLMSKSIRLGLAWGSSS